MLSSAVLAIKMIFHGRFEDNFATMNTHLPGQVGCGFHISVNLFDVLSHKVVSHKIIRAVTTTTRKVTPMHFFNVVFMLRPRFKLHIGTLFIGAFVVVVFSPFSEVLLVLTTAFEEISTAYTYGCFNFFNWGLVYHTDVSLQPT